MFEKFNYYIGQAIKKPYLIKNIIYKKHLGIVLSYDIREDNYKLGSTTKRRFDNVSIERSFDAEQITKFYNEVGRDSMTVDKVEQWLETKNDCWLVYHGNNIVGATWVLFGEVTIPQLSGRCLSKNESIIFNDYIGYVCYTIIDSKKRGGGLNQLLIFIMKEFYKKNTNIKKLIATTGANNVGFIRSSIKNNGYLIGIVEVRNLIGIVKRKEHFIDKKEKCWI